MQRYKHLKSRSCVHPERVVLVYCCQYIKAVVLEYQQASLSFNRENIQWVNTFFFPLSLLRINLRPYPELMARCIYALLAAWTCCSPADLDKGACRWARHRSAPRTMWKAVWEPRPSASGVKEQENSPEELSSCFSLYPPLTSGFHLLFLLPIAFTSRRPETYTMNVRNVSLLHQMSP